jgi:hypothetical protein
MEYLHKCAICGKEFRGRATKKYCSPECAYEASLNVANRYYHAHRKEGTHTTTFTCRCRFCGEDFEAGSSTAKVCKKPECQKQYRLWMNKNEVDRRTYEREVTQARRDRPIRDIVRAAMELGVSYGEYVARYMK